MLWHLILERPPLPRSANFQSLPRECGFDIQTNLSRASTSNHPLYEILTHQANIPPVLRHHRAKCQATKDHPCHQRPKLFKLSNPKLTQHIYPASAIVLVKAPVKALDVLSSPSSLPPHQPRCFFMWPCMASCASCF